MSLSQVWNCHKNERFFSITLQIALTVQRQSAAVPSADQCMPTVHASVQLQDWCINSHHALKKKKRRVSKSHPEELYWLSNFSCPNNRSSVIAHSFWSCSHSITILKFLTFIIFWSQPFNLSTTFSPIFYKSYNFP